MRVILLALIMACSPVLLDCRGGPETMSHYEMIGQHVRLLGWQYDAECDCIVPIYSERRPQQGATVLTEWRFSEEPLLEGDVLWWGLTAVDSAGWRSDQSCP